VAHVRKFSLGSYTLPPEGGRMARLSPGPWCIASPLSSRTYSQYSKESVIRPRPQLQTAPHCSCTCSLAVIINIHPPQGLKTLPFLGEVTLLCTGLGRSFRPPSVQSSWTGSFQARPGHRSETTSFRRTGTRFVQSGIPPL
jgi:hypothetical protein